MEVLWHKSPLTAAEVCERVCGERDWSLATVKTLLARLVQKGAVTAEADGRRYLYSPAIERADEGHRLAGKQLGQLRLAEAFILRHGQEHARLGTRHCKPRDLEFERKLSVERLGKGEPFKGKGDLCRQANTDLIHLDSDLVSRDSVGHGLSKSL